MAPEDKFITENDSIYDVVTKYPEVKKRLLELSEKYGRLNNPVIFNTVAKLTSVKKAASVGGIYWKELVYQLNDAIGLGKEYVERSKASAFAAHGTGSAGASEHEGHVPAKDVRNSTGPRPQWMDKAKDFEVMDVREGGEPFFNVTEKAKTVGSGKGFTLVQVFEPLPLIGYLETMGFEHVTEKVGDTEVRVYFFKK